MSEAPMPTNTCPKCGVSLPSGKTDGLCPLCLLAEAMLPTGAGEKRAAAGEPLAPGEIAPHFPQLEILECLGRGGMGVVYKARQKSLNRSIALKLLAPERVADGKFAERFMHEAQALAALSHPHIVTVHDFGQTGGFYFLLMEFVDGVNLRQAMKAGRFTPEQALAIVPPVCEALQYAHEHGIVHRDIKPENLLLDREGRVKIADFGIAKMLGAESSTGLAESQPAGTPQYMAPEQKEHRRADHRADIYSLGVVLYEMLTGELPADKLQPPSRRVQVDIRIDEIVLRALEKTPELRFQTAADFRTRVEIVNGGKAVAQAARPTSMPGIRFRLVETRDGRRVIVWRSVLAATLAVFAIALVVGAALSLVAKGAILLLVVVALAGIAAFLTVISSVRISFKSGASPHAEPDTATGPPRFSRAAIVGACWVPFTFLSFLAAAMASYQRPGGSPATGPEWWPLAILIPAIFLGVAGPFGTTILGWVAVAQIRRSAGRIHGLQLALFDALVFPLIALDAVIALAGVAMAKMFVDFYANLSVVGVPHIHPPLVTRMANWLSLNKEVAVIVGVVAAIVVNVLIVRAVRRAVRREVASAPPESSSTGNEITTASIAIILALIATALGALAAIRNEGAWRAMALSLLFAGMAIIMALPVRRLAVGKCALIIAALGAVIWPLAALIVVRQAGAAAHTAALGPEIERVEVSNEQAVVKARGSDGAGMIFLFGTAANRWTPGGLYLDAMFDVSLSSGRFERGVRWNVKTRHGIHGRYRLDGPPGPMLGRIAFHPGTPAPEADGSFTIGEFRPDEGEPLPIAVRVENDKRPNSFPTGAHVSRNHLSILATHDHAATTLHYVLFHEGDFSTTSSGSQNRVTNTWVDEGAVRLRNGRSFGFRREALYPDELHLNGTTYDLRKGRVIVLRDDGVAEQFRFFPPVATARDPEAVSHMIHHEDAAPEEKHRAAMREKSIPSRDIQKPAKP